METRIRRSYLMETECDKWVELCCVFLECFNKLIQYKRYYNWETILEFIAQLIKTGYYGLDFKKANWKFIELKQLHLESKT